MIFHSGSYGALAFVREIAFEWNCFPRSILFLLLSGWTGYATCDLFTLHNIVIRQDCTFLGSLTIQDPWQDNISCQTRERFMPTAPLSSAESATFHTRHTSRCVHFHIPWTPNTDFPIPIPILLRRWTQACHSILYCLQMRCKASRTEPATSKHESRFRLTPLIPFGLYDTKQKIRRIITLKVFLSAKRECLPRCCRSLYLSSGGANVGS